VRRLNPGRGEILRTRPDKPGCKRPGHRVNHPPPSSAEVKERVQVHFYSLSVSRLVTKLHSLASLGAGYRQHEHTSLLHQIMDIYVHILMSLYSFALANTIHKYVYNVVSVSATTCLKRPVCEGGKHIVLAICKNSKGIMGSARVATTHSFVVGLLIIPFSLTARTYQ
jgi:hypothetical protein